MTAAREALAARIRESLPDDRPRREVAMFGRLAFMVDDAIAVVAGRDGGVLVRTDPVRHEELLTVAGATPAVMGADRSMGPGWIGVSAEGVATDEALTFWTNVGLEAARAKRPRSSG